jgi:hypothetical protein
MDSSNLLAIIVSMGLVFTVLYAVRRSLVTGLLSVLADFSAAAYWLILDTSLPQIAWVFAAAALVVLIDFMIQATRSYGRVIADSMGPNFDWLRFKGDEEEDEF